MSHPLLLKKKCCCDEPLSDCFCANTLADPPNVRLPAHCTVTITGMSFWTLGQCFQAGCRKPFEIQGRSADGRRMLWVTHPQPATYRVPLASCFAYRLVIPNAFVLEERAAGTFLRNCSDAVTIRHTALTITVAREGGGTVQNPGWHWELRVTTPVAGNSNLCGQNGWKADAFRPELFYGRRRGFSDCAGSPPENTADNCRFSFTVDNQIGVPPFDPGNEDAAAPVLVGHHCPQCWCCNTTITTCALPRAQFLGWGGTATVTI